MRSFPSIEDLLGQIERLAQEHPQRAHLASYGQSQAGEPLWALRLGGGPCRVLAYGFPQPDEPLGGLAVLGLARRLLQEDALCRRATWVLLPCVDPDGARLNEGWFAAPPELASYVQLHYRPPEGEQVEWSFPSSDPAWPWDRVSPETSALQALLDEFQPQVLFPLHNSLVGGAYAFVSPGMAGLAARLPPIWENRGLPTHLGEPELPFAPLLARGVYGLPTLGQMAAALAAQGIADPPGLLDCGAPAYAYAARGSEVLAVVPELPLFTVAGMDQTDPAGLSRRALLREAWAADRTAYDRWEAVFTRAEPFLLHDTPYWRVLAALHRTTAPLLAATASWLEGDPALGRPATIAEAVDCRQIAPVMRLLPFGALLQALEAEAAVGSPSTTLQVLATELRGFLEQALSDLPALLRAQAVQPALLAEVVLEVVFEAVSSCTAGQVVVQ